MLNELLPAVARGNARAFRELYDLTSGPLHSILLGTIGHQALAEEVLQESYIKIWQKAGSYDPARGEPMPWLATVVRNQAMDTLRARRPDEFGADVHAEGMDCTDDSADPCLKLEQAQQADQLRGPLAALPDRFRTSVLLTCYAGYTHEESAVLMGAPLGTLKSWVRRGLQQLRKQMGVAVADAGAA